MAAGFALAVLFLTLRPAAAVTLDEVQQLYTEGHFAETVKEGKALGTFEGLNLAVRAQLIMVQYVYDLDARVKAIDAAVVDAEKAQGLEPDNLEATINLGIIIGLRGKYSRSVSDGKECRDLFEKAVEMDPNSSWALGVLASWNADTIDQAGGIAGRLIFGAKKKEAWRLFDAAIKADPNNLTIRAAYVRALLKLKPGKFAETIDENMKYILDAPSNNALEDIMKRQMLEIKKARAAGDEERLKQVLDEAIPLKPAATSK